MNSISVGGKKIGQRKKSKVKESGTGEAKESLDRSFEIDGSGGGRKGSVVVIDRKIVNEVKGTVRGRNDGEEKFKSTVLG